MEIEHFSHSHPLIPCDIEKWDIEEEDWNWCDVCTLRILGPAYGCPSECCSFFIHKSCGELPREITHPFHPQHPLMLVEKPHYSFKSFDSRCFDCCACGLSNRGFAYQCIECQIFCLDISCASLIPTTAKDSEFEAEQQRLLSTHSHPLTLCKKIWDFEQLCSACQLPINDSVYVCLKCKLLLHESCAELPKKIKHPFHQGHHLTLLTSPALLTSPVPLINCKACLATCGGLVYHCSKCNYYMDVKCASPVRTVRSKIHHHPLAFVHISHPSFGGYYGSFVDLAFSCNVCRVYFKTPDFFRCVDCNFNIHLRCIPKLPQTIKYFGHRHPLTFTDSIIKDYPHEDETDPSIEYYCDACEQQRHLFDSTYCCAECHYVAHIDCEQVAPEVVESLEAASFHTKLPSKGFVSQNQSLLLMIIILLLLLPILLGSKEERCLIRW